MAATPRFSVQLHNPGTLDAPPTPVRYWIDNGSETRELALNTIQPGAGETLTQTIVWRVDLIGDLTFSAEIDPDNQTAETDETNNRATLAFSAGVIDQINLVIDHRDLSFDPEPALEGRPLTISAQVRNTGGTDASNVQVGFYQFEVAPEYLIGAQSIAHLAAGGSATISLEVLQVQGRENRLIYAVADPADLLAEFSEDDNSAFHLLPVKGLADLTLSSGSLDLNPRFPSPEQNVTLTVTVANLGEQAADDVVVRVFDGDPEQGGITVAADQIIGHIDGNSEGQASFTWQYCRCC